MNLNKTEKRAKGNKKGERKAREIRKANCLFH